MPPKAKPPLERFLQKFDRPEEGCWLWNGDILDSGYALFYNGAKQVSAHRFSYETYRGQIPKGLCVLHKCDVRHCVRPDHLFLGTHKDNGQDMALKGRSLRGVRNNNSKLTEATVLEIRKEFAAGKSLNQVSRERGLNLKSVQSLRRGLSWKHVGGPIFPEKMTPQMFAGSKNGRAKLTEEQVLQIKAAYLSGETPTKLAKRFEISRRSVANIVSGRSWKHVT